MRPLRRCRHAILLPGQLRCYARTRDLFVSLSRLYDIFVVTDDAFRDEAEDLRVHGRGVVLITDDDPEARAAAAEVCLPRAQQWLKYALAVDLLQRHEQRRGRRYATLLKLRSDYHHRHPQLLLSPQAMELTDGLLARTDQVFGGRREYMLPLRCLHEAIPNRYLDANDQYFPINPRQILRSDPCTFRWDMLRYPERVVGVPSSPAELLRGIASRQAELLGYRHAPDLPLTPGRGHPRLATERVFAHVLNQLGFSVRAHPMLAGKLAEDRFVEPKPDGPPPGGWQSNAVPWDFEGQFPYPG
jgi:hypothetical protein